MEKIAFAGTFDPLTNGHLWVIQEGLNLADQVCVIIAQNQNKQTLFTADERKEMIDQVLKDMGIDHQVQTMVLRHHYTAQAAMQLGCHYLIRGIRSSLDFDYESLIQKTNTDVLAGSKTLFVMPPRELESVSSSFVKSLVGPIGWHLHIKQFVPHAVYDQWLTRFIFSTTERYLCSANWTNQRKQVFIDEVLNQYRGRPYHGLEHLSLCLQELKCVADQPNRLTDQEIEILCLAILGHDFILYAHDTQQSDEILSAQWFEQIATTLLLEQSAIERVSKLIRATAHLDASQRPDDPLVDLMCDIDLSILAQPSTVYTWYTQAIRDEYHAIDIDKFRQGRKKVVQHFLSLSRIFQSDDFKHYTPLAQHNLQKEYLSLEISAKP